MDRMHVQDLYPFEFIRYRGFLTVTVPMLVLSVDKHPCIEEYLKLVLQIRIVFHLDFDCSHSKPLEPLRLDKLQKWIDDGRIDPTHVITMKTLVDSGLMSSIKYGVKIVAHVCICNHN